MKPTKLRVAGLPVLLSIFMIFFLSSCSRKISFAKSTVVPTAEGSVKIKKDNNKNYSIDLKVIRLAEPKRLVPLKALT
ncbi:hypothetical protein [Segetibacter koreensis]|uniref:hypothetical protein n=1 Tax=Segetibacter koreensis TaxID=398037 RepID=UPI0003785DC6|nr:hypothetical protein [Segetibacter koreensis]